MITQANILESNGNTVMPHDEAAALLAALPYLQSDLVLRSDGDGAAREPQIASKKNDRE